MTPKSFALALAAFVLVGAGCGESGEPTPAALPEPTGGAVLFHEAGCADCHTLTAAGARGRVGPDLDSARPTRADVERQVRLGGAGMPSFDGRLADSQIAALASFVSESVGTADASEASGAAEFEPDGTRLSDCGTEFSCFEQAFGNLTFERGPGRALRSLARAIGTNVEIERDCHRITHVMGAAALGHFDGEVGQAFSQGSPICASGYYHGIAERAFSGSSTEELVGVARELCRDSHVRATTFLAYQCVHGTGHGLMIVTGYRLPRSLAVCDRLETAWDRTACTGGVFMENIATSYGVRSRWLRDDDPLYPCHVVATRHKLYCYLMVTSRILQLVGNDFGRAAALCRRSEPGWVSTCFQSLGRDASGQARGAPARILDLCRPAGGGMGECLYGAARDLTYNDAAPARAAVLCDRAQGRLQDICFTGIGTILLDLYNRASERASACNGISTTASNRASCRRGAGVD